MTKRDFAVMVIATAAEKMKLNFTFVNNFIWTVKKNGEDIADIFEKRELFKGVAPREKLMEAAFSAEKECEARLEQLAKRKIQVVSTENPCYPENLKKRLKEKTPPYFFAVGNTALAKKEAVSVTGVRNIFEEDERYARRLGELCAEEKLVVVSGGAAGVDSVVLDAALVKGGEAVVYLPQGFEKSQFMQKNRRYAEGGTLLCFSLCGPEQGFTKSGALERNIYIHAHGDITVTVRAKNKSGGSWSGACYNLQRGRTPAYVSDIPSPGNEALADMGAKVLARERIFSENFSLREEIKSTKG